MKNLIFKKINILIVLVLVGCSKDEPKEKEEVVVIPPVVVVPPAATDAMTISNASTFVTDKAATPETVAMFYNLKRLAKTKIAIGQQDALNYFYNNISNMTDIKKATGFDPAIHGLDFERITAKENTGLTGNYWYGEQVKIIADAKEAYKRGMVNIFSWHLREPFKEKTFYANTQAGTDAMTTEEKNTAFRSILPGGTNHDWYKGKLDKIAAVVLDLKGDNGELIPIIFRPFHEFDGSWFWWGANFCSAEEYKTAFKFTVDYLKNTKGIHNILYSYGPDNSYDTEAKYLARYPGDAYVDVLGIDNYGDFDNGQGLPGVERAKVKFKVVSDLSKARVKIAALTETGYQVTATKAPISNWFSTNLYNAVTAPNVELSFIMFWNNGNYKDSGTARLNYYVPVPGTTNIQDFKDFAIKPKISLLNSFSNIYVLPTN